MIKVKSTRVPRKISPATVAHYLSGLTYPSDKKALLSKASMNQATEDVLHVLSKMDDKPYKTMVAILEEVNNLWVDPDYKSQTTSLLVKDEGCSNLPQRGSSANISKKIYLQEAQAASIPKKEIDQESDQEGSEDPVQNSAFPKKKRKRKRSRLLLKLCENFPKVFDLQNPKPLKIGIHRDILERLKDDPEVTQEVLKKVMERYVKDGRYYKALLRETHRFDLDGQETEKISKPVKKAAKGSIDWYNNFRQHNKQQETSQITDDLKAQEA